MAASKSKKTSSMSKAKKIIIFVVALVLIIAVIAVIKVIQIRKEIAMFSHMAPPPPTISTASATTGSTQPTAEAVGTFKALNGVSITPQVSGQITSIDFESGQSVEKGARLVQINDRTAKSTLEKDSATFENAKVTLERSKKLVAEHYIDQSTYDTNLMQFKQAKAAVDADKVALDQHTVKAPFSGKLGINQVNVGQYLMPGDSIVTLQTQDPIHLNFNVPEQFVSKLKVGLPVQASVTRYLGKTFQGTLNAISSTIDPDTHTLAVQATFPNKDLKLFPGGFANVKVQVGKGTQQVAIPDTAVTYRLYGNSVYVVTTMGKTHTATLRYVTLGDTIGKDRVAVTKGLKAGDVVVTAGQNKLQDSNAVLINNNVPALNQTVKSKF